MITNTIEKNFGNCSSRDTINSMHMLIKILGKRVKYTQTYIKDNCKNIFFQPEENNVKISVKLYKTDEIDKMIQDDGIQIVPLKERLKSIADVASYEARRGNTNISSYVFTFNGEAIKKHEALLSKLFEQSR